MPFWKISLRLAVESQYFGSPSQLNNMNLHIPISYSMHFFYLKAPIKLRAEKQRKRDLNKINQIVLSQIDVVIYYFSCLWEIK